MVSSIERIHRRLQPLESHTAIERDLGMPPRDSLAEAPRSLEEPRQTEQLHSAENPLQGEISHGPPRIEPHLSSIQELNREENEPPKSFFPKLGLLPGEKINLVEETITPDGRVISKATEYLVGERLGGGLHGDVYEVGKDKVIKTSVPTTKILGVPVGLMRKIHWSLRPFPPQTEKVAAQMECVAGKIISTLASVYFEEKEGKRPFGVVETKGYTWLDTPNPSFALVIEKVNGRGPRYDTFDRFMLRRTLYNRLVKTDVFLSGHSHLRVFEKPVLQTLETLHEQLIPFSKEGPHIGGSNFPFLKPPHEVEEWKKGQKKWVAFCDKTGLVEHKGQGDGRNPFALPNLVKRVFLDEREGYTGEDGEIVQQDIHPAMLMRRSGFVPPFFFLRFHREIYHEAREEGGTEPVLNRIYTDILRKNIEDHPILYEETLGAERLEELRGYVNVYDALRAEYDRNRQENLRTLNIRWWRQSNKISAEFAARLEDSRALYYCFWPLLTLTRPFGQYLGNKEYQAHIHHLISDPLYRAEFWNQYKEIKAKTWRHEQRLGPEQEIPENLRFFGHFVLSKVMPIKRLHRLIMDSEYREGIKEDFRKFRTDKDFRFQVVGERLLAHAKEAFKKTKLTRDEWERIQIFTSTEALKETSEEIEKGVRAYIPAFAAYLGISFVGNFIQLPSLFLALETGDVKILALAFVPGLTRLAFTIGWERLTKVDFGKAKKICWLPTIGTALGIPSQMMTTLGTEFEYLLNIELRHYIAKATRILPWGGEDSPTEYKAWRGLVDLPTSVAYELGEVGKKGKEAVKRAKKKVFRR